MLKSILNFDGVSSLSKDQQINISGGTLTNPGTGCQTACSQTEYCCNPGDGSQPRCIQNNLWCGQEGPNPYGHPKK